MLVEPKQLNVLKLDQPVNVRKLKYYYIRESGEHRCTPVSSELQSAMTKLVFLIYNIRRNWKNYLLNSLFFYIRCRTIDHFEKIAEIKPKEIKLHGTDRATKLWRYWMTQEPADFNLLLGNGSRLNPILELVKKLTFSSNYTMASIYSLIDDILPKEKADKIKEITRKCDEELTVTKFDDLRQFCAAKI